MGRFKSFGFRRLILSFLFLILLLTFFSCSNYKKIKIEIFDMNGLRLNDLDISIVGYLNKKVEKEEDLTFYLKKQEYLIRVIKDGYFPYEEKFDLNNSDKLIIKLKSVEDEKIVIEQTIENILKNLNNFYVDFIGKVDEQDINFTAYFDLLEKVIKVNSKYLNEEVVIKKIDSKYFYNNSDIPQDLLKYFDEVVKLINNSVMFVKNLPLTIENKNYRSSNGYIIIDFEKKTPNLEIYGYIILDGFNLSFNNEFLHIKTIDELRRESEIYLNFYIK